MTNPNGHVSLTKEDKIVTHNPDEGLKERIHHTAPNALEVIESGGEVCGPHRVLPGRLSVSRAIGDAHAKVKA